MSASLEQRKRIDAICDRFELAWAAGERPRIEDYLEGSPEVDPAALLRELLASELALRDEHREPCEREEFEQRFPHRLDVVARVFARRASRLATPPPEPTLSPDGAKCIEIVRAIRARLLSDAAALPGAALSAAASPPPEANGRGGAAEFNQTLARYAGHHPGLLAVPLEQSLRAWILHACAKRDRLLLSDVESVILQLLEQFTPLRRAILLDALLGRPLSDIAASKKITERTVASTLGIAATLVEQAISKEATDLAAQQPERMAKMTAELAAWKGSVERSLAGADYPASS